MTVTHQPVRDDVEVWATMPTPQWSDDDEQRAALGWDEARRDRPELFDGPVYAPSEWRVDPNGRLAALNGSFVPYRYYLAARRDTQIANRTGLWVMGVCGVLRCPEGLVAGRRASNTTNGGTWELIPAGTIDNCDENGRVDCRKIFLHELDQELGLSRESEYSVPTPFAYVATPAIRVADLAFALDTSESFADLLARHESLPNKEYDQIALVRPGSKGGSIDAELNETSRKLVSLAEMVSLNESGLRTSSIESNGEQP